LNSILISFLIHNISSDKERLFRTGQLGLDPADGLMDPLYSDWHCGPTTYIVNTVEVFILS